MESTYLNEIQKAPFLFLKDHPWDYFKPVSETLDKSANVNLCDDETFFKTFMSELNIQYINTMIKKTVYNNNCNKYIIRDQKKEHLKQIMEGIYHDNAQHLDFDQKKQFNILNKLVIDYCVDTILKEIEMRNKFVKDKFSPLELLPPPINTSISGSKSYLPIISSKYKIEDIYQNKKDNVNIESQRELDNDSPPIKNITYHQLNFPNDRNNMFLETKNVTENNINTKTYYKPQSTPGIYDNNDIFSSHQIIKN